MAEKKEKAISDEAVIAAILSNRTMADASKACGLSVRAMYERMQDDADFKVKYLDAKNRVLRDAVTRLNDRMADAVDVVAEIMMDETVNAATRLQAAQTVLANAAKLADKMSDEDAKAARIASPPYDINEIFKGLGIGG